MAKFSTSLNQLKEFAKIAKEPIDAQSLNKSIASMVSSLAVLQELASTANSGNISKLKKEYNALFEIVQKIQQFQKNGGSTKDAKLTGSATSMSKSIDKLEDRMMAYYGKSKKEAESYLVKQRQLVEEMKKEGVSAKEKYEISRKINRLNTASLETVKNIQASENKHTATREKDYQNQLKSLSASKQKNVIDEKATNSKLKQLQIDMAIGKRSIEESLSRKKVLSTISAEEAERRKINEALKADVLLRDRISKLNKKEYGTPSKTPSKTNYIEQEERERKKITDALKRDILRRDEQERASQAKKIDYIKQEELAREKITNALKEDILLRDRIAKLDKKEAVNATPKSNKNLVDEMKIKEKNIKLNNQLLAFETKMQGFAGGRIKSVQKELENIRRLQAAHKTLGNAMVKEGATAEQINKIGLKRIDIEGKIANQQRVASNLANKGTLLSNTMSNLSIGKLANRASFVATAKLSYTAMQSVSDIMRSLIKLNVELEDQFSKAFSIAQNKSEAFHDEMKRGALNIMSKYNQTLEETAEAMYNVISAQIDETKAMSVMNASAKLAKANLSDFGDTAKLVSGILNAYNLDANEASRVSDVLSRSIQLGVITMAEYDNGLGKLLPSAQAVGFSIEEVTSTIATLTKNGMKADQAMTSLRQVFQMITSPSKKQKKLLSEYNIELDARVAKENGLIETLKMLGGLMLEDEFELSTSRRGREAYLGMIHNMTEAQETLNEVMNASGATDEILAVRLNTLSSNWQTLKDTTMQFIAVNSVTDGIFGKINEAVRLLNDSISLMAIPSIKDLRKEISRGFATDPTKRKIDILADSMQDLTVNSDEFKKRIDSINSLLNDYGIVMDNNYDSMKAFNDELERSVGLYENIQSQKAWGQKKIDIESEMNYLKMAKQLEEEDLGITAFNENRKKLINEISQSRIGKDGINVISAIAGKRLDQNKKLDDMGVIEIASLTGSPFELMSVKETSKWGADISNSIFETTSEIYDKLFKNLDISAKKNKRMAIVSATSDKQYNDNKFKSDEFGLIQQYIKEVIIGKNAPENSTELDSIIIELTKQGRLLDLVNVHYREATDKVKGFLAEQEELAKTLKTKKDKADNLKGRYYAFKSIMYDVDDTKDKVGARKEIKNNITKLQALIKEGEGVVDETTMQNMQKAVKSLTRELDKYIRGFSDFSMQTEKKLNEILETYMIGITDKTTDEELNERVDYAFKDMQELLGDDKFTGEEIARNMEDFKKAFTKNLLAYDPYINIDIPFKIKISRGRANILDKVTDKMTQSEYNDIINEIVAFEEKAYTDAMGEEPSLLKSFEIRQKARGDVSSKAQTRPSLKPSLKKSFLDSIGWDSESANFDEANASPEEKLAQTEKFNQMVADTTINSMSQMYDVLNQMQLQHIENQLQNKLDAIDAEEEARINAVNSEILTEEHRGREINAINNKYNKKREKAEEKATKEQAKINKRMAIIDATMSFANASMGIWSFWSDKQPVMIPIMQALLAGVYGANLALINGTKYRDGGMLEGASHENGGIPLLGRSGNYYGEAEGGEIIFSKRASDKNTELLLSMNKHLSSGGDLSTFLTSYLNGRSSGGNAKVGSMYRDGGMTRRFSQNGATIDSSMFDNFAFIDMKGVDETKLYQMWKIGKIKDRSL